MGTHIQRHGNRRQRDHGQNKTLQMPTSPSPTHKTSQSNKTILTPLGIRICFKPHYILRNFLVCVEDMTSPESQTGIVYQVFCSDCPATYIGQTGGTDQHRLYEHKYALTSGNLTTSADTEQAADTGHAINWDKTRC